MADRNDDFEKPKPHPAPDKSIVDWVVDHALGLGSGVVTLMSGLLAAVLILYSGYVLYDTFSIEQSAASSAWDLLRYKPEIIEDADVPLTGSSLAEINQESENETWRWEEASTALEKLEEEFRERLAALKEGD